MRQASIPTPFLRLDLPVVQDNLRRMASYAAEHGLKLRPHTKTHKNIALAAMQLAGGASGLTVAKAGEAQVMARAGEAVDLLVAYPALDAHRAVAVAALAGQTTVRVAIDSLQAANALQDAARQAGTQLGILVDLDVGQGRTGVASATDALLLAQQVDCRSHLQVQGIFCYPGHITCPPADQPRALADMAAKLDEAISLLQGHGLDTSIVSGGSTPTAYQAHRVAGLTEIRPGTYLFNDMNTLRSGHCTLEQCAARIVATVISTAVAGQVVIDAGSKTLTSDPCRTDPALGYGYVVEYPEAIITRLSEEHGQIDVSRCPQPPRASERLTVIPNHICPCVNLQDQLWGAEGDQLQPLKVDARGLLS